MQDKWNDATMFFFIALPNIHSMKVLHLGCYSKSDKKAKEPDKQIKVEPSVDKVKELVF